MTFEEARALFPVLERVAYLNAGTFGPLARPVADALVEAVVRDAEQGRSGLPYFEETLALRDEARSAFAALVGAEPAQVALTSSTTEGCGIVVPGLGLEPGDEVVTTTDEHFGLLGPLGASAATVRQRPCRQYGQARGSCPLTRARKASAASIDCGRGSGICSAARTAASRSRLRPGASKPEWRMRLKPGGST